MANTTVEVCERPTWLFEKGWQRGAGTGIARIAGPGAGRFERLFERADLENEGAVIALETLARGRFRPELSSIEGYIHAAVKRSLAKHVARELRRRRLVDVCGDGVLDGEASSTPEADLLARESRERLAAWRAQSAAEVRRVLGTMTGRDRRIAESLWGLNGIPGDQSPGACQKLARRHRVPVAAIYKVRVKLRRRMLASARLRRLMQELNEIRETIDGEET